MSKCGRIVAIGNEHRIADVIDIPNPLPSWADSPTDFAAKMFPDLGEFIEVPPDTISGAISNGDGTYANPVAAAPWVPPRIGTILEFKRRFTPQERIAIRASTNPVVIDFMDLLDSAQDVNFADQDLKDGVGYLESAGLIATGRAAEILG